MYFGTKFLFGCEIKRSEVSKGEGEPRHLIISMNASTLVSLPGAQFTAFRPADKRRRWSSLVVKHGESMHLWVCKLPFVSAPSFPRMKFGDFIHPPFHRGDSTKLQACLCKMCVPRILRSTKAVSSGFTQEVY